MFNYDEIIEKIYQKDEQNQYEALADFGGPFIHLKHSVADISQMHTLGWKAHIRVDEHDTDNLRKTWDILQEVVFKYQIWRTKIVKNDAEFFTKPLDKGSQVTIYCFFQLNLDWKTIFTELTDKLIKAQVIPSAEMSYADKPIAGSDYITYRNDDLAYNPAVSSDPFANITIQLDNKEVGAILEQPTLPNSPGSSSTLLPK